MLCNHAEMEGFLRNIVLIRLDVKEGSRVAVMSPEASIVADDA